MMHPKIIFFVFSAVLLVPLVACTNETGLSKEEGTSNRITLTSALANDDTVGYRRANKLRDFKFPSDHGAHPGFKTEWWYYTGNLHTESGREFGFQFTIFRSAVRPDTTQGESTWASNDIYMGHFTVTDIKSGKFYASERFSRSGNQLAGAVADPFYVWLEDWQVKLDGESSPDGRMPVMLIARAEDAELELHLAPLKPIVLQGDKGLSQKSSAAGNASYYYSMTRLDSKGTVKIGNNSFEVTGLSWMDREWSTSALGKDQVGWDWFSLHLPDGRDLMYYQLRLTDGSPDPLSKGVIVEPDGTKKEFTAADIELSVQDYWDSPLGGTYPSAWTLNVERLGIALNLKSLLPNQELDVTVRYWEGAVSVKTGSGDTGRGYVEMTGYAD